MRVLSVLLLIFLAGLPAIGQLDERSGWLYKNSAYDVFVMRCDRIDPLNVHAVGNTNQMDEASFFNSFRAQGVFFAITAGIVDSGCISQGLLIDEGKEVHPVNLDSGSGNFFLKPNGVLGIDPTGKFEIITSEQQKDRKYLFAVQSGPMLLINGQIHPSFDIHSQNRNLRCGAGICRKGKGSYLIFIRSLTSVSFYEFATLFKDKFGCSDALTMESGVHCSMHLPTVKKQYGSYQAACRYLYIKLE